MATTKVLPQNFLFFFLCFVFVVAQHGVVHCLLPSQLGIAKIKESLHCSDGSAADLLDLRFLATANPETVMARIFIVTKMIQMAINTVIRIHSQWLVKDPFRRL